MLFVHGFAGGLTTYYTLKNQKELKLTRFQIELLWLVGVVGGIFPDLDLIYVYFNKDVHHRELISHSIVLYLLLFIIVNVLSHLFKEKKHIKDYFQLLNLVFFTGVLGHLFIDFFVGGLSLFNPISKYYFGFSLPYALKSPDWQYQYFGSFYMVLETIVALWFIDILKNIKSFVGRYLPFLLVAVAFSATIFLMYR